MSSSERSEIRGGYRRPRLRFSRIETPAASHASTGIATPHRLDMRVHWASRVWPQKSCTFCRRDMLSYCCIELYTPSVHEGRLSISSARTKHRRAKHARYNGSQRFMCGVICCTHTPDELRMIAHVCAMVVAVHVLCCPAQLELHTRYLVCLFLTREKPPFSRLTRGKQRTGRRFQNVHC